MALAVEMVSLAEEIKSDRLDSVDSYDSYRACAHKTWLVSYVTAMIAESRSSWAPLPRPVSHVPPLR